MGNNKPNKTLCIIGGNRGIGKAAAAHGVARGDNVIITGRDLQTLNSTLEELKDMTLSQDQRVQGFVLDVRDSQALKDLFSKSITCPLDLLIYSAGYSYPGYAEETPLGEFRTQIETNLIGAAETALAALPLLKQAGGTVVFISSLAGLMGVFGYSG
ncbi:MAG: SDR family NAD(P)-dependent oxidoreductase, partial [Spirochaetaceae bacterium]|nr:SDR family NAD(P)-dependent oxidoreductase [Spirochaetaceae bacterium]